jgi:hypothetical protein
LDDPPSLLRLEDSVVSGIVVTPQTVRDVPLRKDGVQQAGLNFIFQDGYLLEFLHGTPFSCTFRTGLCSEYTIFRNRLATEAAERTEKIGSKLGKPLTMQIQNKYFRFSFSVWALHSSMSSVLSVANAFGYFLLFQIFSNHFFRTRGRIMLRIFRVQNRGIPCMFLLTPS